MSEEQQDFGSPKDEEGENVTVSDFNVNYRDFLATPVLYSNLPHVTNDGATIQMTFMTWTLAPGAIFPPPEGEKNPLAVTARIAMPMQSAEILMKLLADNGVRFPEAQKEDEKGQE